MDWQHEWLKVPEVAEMLRIARSRAYELVAVIGRAFDPGLLCGAGGREEGAIYGIIEPLVASGLIV